MGLSEFEIELDFYQAWVKEQAKNRVPQFTEYELNLCATTIMQWEKREK